MEGKTGERIQQARKFLRKSQEEFGGEMGVSQSRQSRIEKNETEIPTSYLDRIIEKYGEYINEAWLRMGKGTMENTSGTREPDVDYYSNINTDELSPEEAQILAEVKQFSDFLKNRPLRPAVKRVLLERLIESIDQALEPLQHDRPQSSRD